MSDAKTLKAMEDENGRLLDTLLDAAALAGTGPLAWLTAKARSCSTDRVRSGQPKDSGFHFGDDVQQKHRQKRTLSLTRTALMASPQAPARRLRSSRPSDLTWSMLGASAVFQRSSRLTVGDRRPKLCVTWIPGAAGPWPRWPLST